MNNAFVRKEKLQRSDNALDYQARIEVEIESDTSGIARAACPALANAANFKTNRIALCPVFTQREREGELVWLTPKT